MATKFAISRRKADDAVIGTWRGSGKKGIPVAAPDSDHDVFEVTEVEYADVTKKGLLFPAANEHRFKYVGGALVEQTDGRARIRFEPTLVEADVGERPQPQVTVSVLNPDGTVKTSVNVTRVVQLIRGKPMKLVFSNGQAVFRVPTGRAYEVEIGEGLDVQVEAPLTVRVASADLEEPGGGRFTE